MPSEELVRALRRLLRGRKHPPIDVNPGCPFGAIVQQRLEGLERQLQEIKGKLYTLFFLVMGAVVVEMVMRLLG